MAQAALTIRLHWLLILSSWARGLAKGYPLSRRQLALTLLQNRMADQNAELKRELSLARRDALLSRPPEPLSAGARRRSSTQGVDGCASGAATGWEQRRRVLSSSSAAGPVSPSRAAAPAPPPLPSSTPPVLPISLAAPTWFSAADTVAVESGDAGRPSSARAVADGLSSRMRFASSVAASAASSVSGGRSAVVASSVSGGATVAAKQSREAMQGASSGAQEVGRVLWKKVKMANELAHEEPDAVSSADEPHLDSAVLQQSTSKPTMDADVASMASKLQGLQAGMRAKQEEKRAVAAVQQQQALDDLRSVSCASPNVGTLEPSSETVATAETEQQKEKGQGSHPSTEDIVTDPLFQFFYLTAQSHKVNCSHNCSHNCRPCANQ